MNILLVAGPDVHAVQPVWQTLKALGVGVAKPSRRENMLPEQIHDLMRISLMQTAPVGQGDGELNEEASLKKLGKVWHELASDLCLGNMDSGLWGWPMDDNATVLDYWLDFDPCIRLVLAYVSPIEYLQEKLQEGMDITPLLVEQTLLRWTERYEAILARFHTHGPQCLLVHAATAQSQSALLVEAMDKEWAMPVQSTVNMPMSPQVTPPAIYQFNLLSGLAATDAATEALWQELQATAHICAPEQLTTQLTVFQHLAQQLLTQRQAHDAKQTIANLEGANARLEGDKAWLSSFCADQSKENELLLLQLHQVQDELEHYFLLHQSAIQQLQLQQLPSEIQLDMCEPIVGHNWYHAESDGRWAGPGLVSTLQMPPVAAGRYQMELHIKDAMQPDIVLGQQVCVLADGECAAQPVGLAHNFSAEADLYPVISVGVVDLKARTKPWKLQLELQHNDCPADSGGDDTRRLGLKLQAVRLIRQELLII